MTADGLRRLVGPDPAPKRVAGGFGSITGPVFSRLGYLLFSDTAVGRIMKWERGKVSVFRENSNGPTGLTFDHQGRLLACERNRVTRTEKDGRITVLAEGLEAPWDLVYAIDGSIYFSDAGPAAEEAAVYQLRRTGALRVASRDCERPAGLALAPNQQKLYVADRRVRRIWVYDIAGDGALRNGRAFAHAESNGLKSDEAGNVWAVDGQSISVFDAQGRRVGGIPLPEAPNNCAWGDGFRNLYVTTETSVYMIETKVNGTRTY